MKKLILIFCIIFVAFSANAQYKYSVRAMGYGGKILPLSKNLEATAKGMVLGGEIAFEFQPTGKHQWEQFWNFPTIGIGFVGLDLGNPQILGQAFAVYPYLLVPVIDSRYFQLNYKIGTGMSFITKTWKRADTESGVNAPTANSAIGSVVNIYLNTGFNFEFPINYRFSLTADLGYSHMSNGSVITPNGGLNILYGQIGAKYNFIDCPECRFVKNPAYKLPYNFIVNIGMSGGVRQLYYKENKNYFVGAINAGMTAPLANWYALGGSFDLFFDGAFNKKYDNGWINSFTRYYLIENKFENKIRAGISINNEFIIGRLTGIFDWGIYLYNPLKNFEPGGEIVTKRDKKPFNKGIFYKYNIEEEDGWNYFRLGLKYRVWDNIFVSVNLKTHLQKAEMITFGFGYYLPFARGGKYAPTKKQGSKYYLYRFNQKEVPDFPTPWY